MSPTQVEIRGYKSDLDRVIRCLGHVRLHELTPMQLETAYAEMMKSGSARGGPLSAKTVYNAHSSLRKALNDGVRLGVLIRNPATAARPPKRTKPEMETWTAAQLGEFLAGVEDDPLHAAYVLIATTGMRRGEAMGLRWQDVDLDAGFVRIRQSLTTVNDQLVFDTTKTSKSQRRISLDESTIAITLDTYGHVVEGMDADAATTVADQIFKSSTKPKKVK